MNLLVVLLYRRDTSSAKPSIIGWDGPGLPNLEYLAKYLLGMEDRKCFFLTFLEQQDDVDEKMSLVLERY